MREHEVLQCRHGGPCVERRFSLILTFDIALFQTKAVKQLRHPVAAGYLNIRGVYLHILADALGSVVVIISALIIWKTDWEYRFVTSSDRNLYVRGFPAARIFLVNSIEHEHRSWVHSSPPWGYQLIRIHFKWNKLHLTSSGFSSTRLCPWLWSAWSWSPPCHYSWIPL